MNLADAALKIQVVWTFRQYDRAITKSLPEEPTDAATFFEVDAVWNHRSTTLCSCNDGITGWPRHMISTYKQTNKKIEMYKKNTLNFHQL